MFFFNLNQNSFFFFFFFKKQSYQIVSNRIPEELVKLIIEYQLQWKTPWCPMNKSPSNMFCADFCCWNVCYTQPEFHLNLPGRIFRLKNFCSPPSPPQRIWTTFVLFRQKIMPHFFSDLFLLHLNMMFKKMVAL